MKDIANILELLASMDKNKNKKGNHVKVKYVYCPIGCKIGDVNELEDPYNTYGNGLTYTCPEHGKVSAMTCNTVSDFVCRTHPGVHTEQINIPNMGNYCSDYVEAMHEELHHYIRLYNSRKYFDNFHRLASTTKLDEIIKQECKFCKEEA